MGYRVDLRVGIVVIAGALCGLACEAGGSGSGDALVLSDGAVMETAGSGSDTQSAGPSLVCERWNADRGDMREGQWTGAAATCDPGDVLEPARENTLRLVNMSKRILNVFQYAGLDRILLIE